MENGFELLEEKVKAAELVKRAPPGEQGPRGGAAPGGDAPPGCGEGPRHAGEAEGHGRRRPQAGRAARRGGRDTPERARGSAPPDREAGGGAGRGGVGPLYNPRTWPRSPTWCTSRSSARPTPCARAPSRTTSRSWRRTSTRRCARSASRAARSTPCASRCWPRSTSRTELRDARARIDEADDKRAAACGDAGPRAGLGDRRLTPFAGLASVARERL